MNWITWLMGGVAGVVPGIAMYFHYVEERYLEPQRQLMFTIGSWAILALCIVFAVIAYRKKNGQISLGQTMVRGLAVSSIRGIVVILFYSIWFLTSPTMFDKPAELAYKNYVANMDEADRTDENIQKVETAIHAQFTPLGQAKSVLFESLIIGAVIAVLTAGFLATPSNKQITIE